MGIAAFLFGVPSALSHGASDLFTNMSITLPWTDAIIGFQEIVDYIFGTFFIVVVALTTCLYVAWKLPIENIVGELDQGSPAFKAGNFASRAFVFFIRFVCPTVILLVLLNMMGVFGIFAGA